MSNDALEFPPSAPGVVRCAMCLQPITHITFHPVGYYDQCPNGNHLHWRCECGFSFATKTAEDSGRDATRQ